MRLFILLLVALSITPPLLTDEAGVQQIVALLDSGEPDKALLRADSVLAQGDEQPQAQFLKARALEGLGRDADAVFIYRDLMERFPKLPEPKINLAVLLVKAGKIDQAQTMLRNVFDADKSMDVAYRNLSAIYAHRARQAYQSALQQESKNLEPLQLAGMGKILSYRSEVRVTFHAEIKAVLQKWKTAWSDKNPDVYLDQYAKTFVPESSVSFTEWSEYRRNRLLAPKFIHVSIDGIDITDHKNGLVSAAFKQTYSSNTFKDSVQKILTLKKSAARWKIIKEVVAQ